MSDTKEFSEEAINMFTDMQEQLIAHVIRTQGLKINTEQHDSLLKEVELYDRLTWRYYENHPGIKTLLLDGEPVLTITDPEVTIDTSDPHNPTATITINKQTHT